MAKLRTKDRLCGGWKGLVIPSFFSLVFVRAGEVSIASSR
jgi:hypothetical protein